MHYQCDGLSWLRDEGYIFQDLPLGCVVEGDVPELNVSLRGDHGQSVGKVLDLLRLGHQLQHVLHVDETLLDDSENNASRSNII